MPIVKPERQKLDEQLVNNNPQAYPHLGITCGKLSPPPFLLRLSRRVVAGDQHKHSVALALGYDKASLNAGAPKPASREDWRARWLTNFDAP